MLSSIGSSVASSWMANTSQMVDKLFSQIDTKNQGYIDETGLTSALQQVSGSSTNSSNGVSADELFTHLDTNGDGKVTKQEMVNAMKKMEAELQSQFDRMRTNGAMGANGSGAPPPPPPPSDDAGFTKDELTAQLQQIGSTDSKRSSLLTDIINNFDKADTDGDGKVSFKEAMAYKQASSTTGSTSTTASSSSSTATSSSDTDAKVLRQIMQLMHAYGVFGQNSSQSTTSRGLSVSA